VNAETDLNIAKIRQEIASKQKDIAITKATAEAEASRLKSQQTQASSLELLSIQTDIDALKKWTGAFRDSGQAGQTIVITPETLQALQGRERSER